MASSKNNEREARAARDRLRRYNARQSVHENQSKRRKRDNFVAVGGVVLIATLATFAQIFYFSGGPGTPVPTPTASQTPEADGNVGDIPDPSESEGRLWTGELDLNTTVNLSMELDGVNAPQGVAAFVAAIQDGYFVDKTCHRLVRSATAGLLQCGSLDGTGASEPDYRFGPIENAPVDGIYPAGTIALARSGNDAFSQGHQFFIVFEDAQLPDDTAGGYTVIGTVTSGLELLISEIADGGITGGLEDGAPVVPTVITRMTIE